MNVAFWGNYKDFPTVIMMLYPIICDLTWLMYRDSSTEGTGRKGACIFTKTDLTKKIGLSKFSGGATYSSSREISNKNTIFSTNFSIFYSKYTLIFYK